MSSNLEAEYSPRNELQPFLTPDHQVSLVRCGTLLSVNGTPGRNAAELKSILGGSNARLKSGASLPPAPGRRADAEGTPLEQARSRARVEVDLVLDSKTCIQGGYLRGHIMLMVPKCVKNEIPVMISGAKIRVIGFETISNQRDRYPFYQCSSPLSTSTVTSGSLHGSLDDTEDFAWAIEGEHKLPFSIHLPISTEHGAPKGVIQAQSEVAVRYIAMVSIKIKDSVSDSRSIAHFYRDCEIWPKLDPSIILAPTSGPSEATALKGLFLGGSGKVDLKASVHRLHWVAGQQCFVDISVINSSKKAITSLTLSLIRTTVVLKPNCPLDTFQDGHDMDPDACQTSTSHKDVAESALEMRHRGIRGHASAKGWWAGVPPGETLEFSHSIILPPDALTVPRGRLLEVEYSIQVTLSAGPLRTANVQTSIPIQIVNFISFDPPPSFFVQKANLEQYAGNTKPLISAPLMKPHGTRPLRVDVETLSSCNSSPRAELRSFSEISEKMRSSIERSSHSSICDTGAPPPEHDEVNHQGHIEDRILRFNTRQETYSRLDENLMGLAMYEDEDEENVSYLLHVDPDFENAPRFADLYHVSTSHDTPRTREVASPDYLNPEVVVALDTMDVDRMHGRKPRPSSFARRVQAKLEAAVTASNSRTGTGDVLSNDSTMWIESHTHRSMSDSMSATGKPMFLSLSLDHDVGYSAGDRTSTTSSAGFQNEQGQGPELYVTSGYDEMSLLNTGTTQLLVPTTTERNTEPCYGRSRQLPRPPAITATPFDTMSSRSMERSTSSMSPTAQREKGARFGSDNQNYHALANDSQHLHSSRVSEMEGRNDDPSGAALGFDAHPLVLSTRPTISMLKDHAAGGMGGSSTSVKERIKELEERQRLLE